MGLIFKGYKNIELMENIRRLGFSFLQYDMKMISRDFYFQE